MSILSIKTAIKDKLDALVSDNVLNGATISDIKKDPLSADIPSFPHAFLMPPAVESETLDNRSNTRTYTFGILILVNAENLSSTTELEEMVEGVLNKFDNDPTLGGTAQGGILPVSSAPAALQHNGKDLIAVEVQIQAKEAVSFSFA